MKIKDRQQKPKLIVILGPTASGKSDLAVFLAKKIGKTEIVCADSRQIYKQMNIGTGKITRKEMAGIPHHIIDIINPNRQFSVGEYQKLAQKEIKKILQKNKTPIICGGTGFYIRSIIDNIVIPKVKPNPTLRKKLENKTTEELFNELKKLDPNRAQNIDRFNKRRLIRALEIIAETKCPIPELKNDPQYETLLLEIKTPTNKLRNNINKRVDKMIKTGLEKEAKRLVGQYGWNNVLKNTIGYKEWNSLKDKTEIIKQIKNNSFGYAKKQITWFSKYTPKTSLVKSYFQSEKAVKKFLKTN